MASIQFPPKFSGYLLISCIALAAGYMADLNAATSITWKDTFYNPKAQDDDVVLPMPCGGAMAFRRVMIPTEGPLSDLRVDLGSTDAQHGYAENTLTQHIAGSFTKAPSQDFILMGKYEVSDLQYQAVMQKDCPNAAMKLRLPHGNTTWFDAVSFSNQWTEWLLKNAPEQLAKNASQSGFVRLPSEVEWEYAARGGSAVSVADFRETYFPMPEGMTQYVWFAGSKSANGKPQLTGLLSPNPLGLYDILGNVDEITLDAFRLNHLDRLHGQVGGFVVRGGNYFTAEQDIRVSYRKEMPHFNEQGPFRAATNGFRVVLSTPVITSTDRLQAIQQAWSQLGKTEESTKSDNAGLNKSGADNVKASDKAPLAAVQDDPLDEINVLAAATANNEVKDRLARLGQVIRASQEAELQQRKRAARASLRMGGVICQQMGKDALTVEIRQKNDQKFCPDDPKASGLFTEEECAKRRENYKVEEQRYLKNLGLYADSVIEVARTYEPSELTGFAKQLITDLNATESGKVLADFVKIYQTQTQQYSENWNVRRQQWAEACKAKVVE